MTNKQAYAGLLERLAVGVTWSDGKPIGAVVGEVNDPVMLEAAEAISSLLKALKPFADAYRDAEPYRDFDGRDCREMCVVNAVSLSDFEAAYAALNSDAPLSIGEEQ